MPFNRRADRTGKKTCVRISLSLFLISLGRFNEILCLSASLLLIASFGCQGQMLQ